MKEEIKSAFRGKEFKISLAAMLICLLCFSLPTWIIRCGQGDREYMSALDLSFAPVFFGGSMLILPFCAVITYTTSQVSDIQSGAIYSKLIRGSIRKYAAGKGAAAFISAFCAVFFASIFHSLLWHILAGCYDPINRPDCEVSFASGTIYDMLTKYPLALPAYLHQAFGFGLTAACWSLFGLCCALWFSDKLLCITIPVIIYYSWWCRMLDLITGWRLPRPAALFNDGQTWESWGIALTLYLAFMGACILSYYFTLRKKVRN